MCNAVKYEVLKNKECKVKDLIKKDVTRTIPESEFIIKRVLLTACWVFLFRDD